MSESTVSLEHPWPYLSPIFKLKNIEGNTVTLVCLLCSPKYTDADDDDVFFTRKNTKESSNQDILEQYLHTQTDETYSISTWPCLKELFIKLNSHFLLVQQPNASSAVPA